MAPPDRRCVRQKVVGYDFATGAEVGDGIGNIGRVPIDDGSDDQVESGGTELLGLMCPVGDAALLGVG